MLLKRFFLWILVLPAVKPRRYAPDGETLVQFFRSLVGCVVTCAVAAMGGKLHTLTGQRSMRGLLAVRGIAGSASMTGLYQAIIMLPLADAVGNLAIYTCYGPCKLVEIGHFGFHFR